MNCPGLERIAAAAAGEDRDAIEHALECTSCRAQLDEQRAVRRWAEALSGPLLTATQRVRLADGVMARVAALPPGGSSPAVRRVGWLVAAVLALYVLGSLAGDRGSVHRSAAVPDERAERAEVALRVAGGSATPSASEPGAPGARSTAFTPPAASDRSPPGPAMSDHASPLAGAPLRHQPGPSPVSPNRSARDAASTRQDAPDLVSGVAAAKIDGPGAQFGREARNGRDVIELRDGELTIDARNAAPVELRSGTTAIRIADAKVTVTARTGAVATVSVFAGSVELSSGPRSTIVSPGTVWEAAAPPATDPDASLEAFRSGWVALRRGELAVAIAAFDRATDPVVREDAAFWAAISAERSGDHAAAHRRFVEFLARFPDSPRVEAVRRALAGRPR